MSWLDKVLPKISRSNGETAKKIFLQACGQSVPTAERRFTLRSFATTLTFVRNATIICA